MAKIKVSFEQLVELRHRNDVSIYIEENSVEAHIKDVSVRKIDPVKLLPDELRGILHHRAAFRRAFECGYITYKGGKFVSKFSSVYKLAYFLGRCFSNDKIGMHSKNRYIVGQFTFPAAALERAFGLENLKKSRQGAMKTKNLRCYKFIDSLFVSKR